MSLWCLVPARRGSVGVKDKNIHPLPDGSTCLGRAVAMAWRFTMPWRVVVSTDYTPQECAQSCHPGTAGFTVIRQPALCASGGGSMLALMTHAMLEVGAAVDDVVMLLQPSSPFRTEATGKQVFASLGRYVCDSVCSAMPIPAQWHPSYTLIPGKPWNPPKRRQDLAPAFRPDGGFYVTRIAQLLAGSWGSMGVVESAAGESLSIDTPEDWAEAERRIASTLDCGIYQPNEGRERCRNVLHDHGPERHA